MTPSAGRVSNIGVADTGVQARFARNERGLDIEQFVRIGGRWGR